MPKAKLQAVRLGPEHDAKLERIAEERRWSKATTLRAALDLLDRQVFGRRAADARPIRRRSAE